MKRIHFANILLICVLGTLFFWPNIPEQVTHESVSTAYESVCMIASSTSRASGVLLESGYVITAAHVIDTNSNGIIDDSEENVTLRFQSNNFEVQAKAIAIGNYLTGLDVAILVPDEEIPLTGVKLMTKKEYWSLKIGTPIYTIGMQNGEFPSNITDGRIISMDPLSDAHRNSASIYYGNSGGGVFVNNKLAGIASAMGMGRFRLDIPLIAPNGRQFGVITVQYRVPLANAAIHAPASSIRRFIEEEVGLEDDLVDDILREHPPKYPYEAYFTVLGFNIALIVWLFLVFKLMRRLMK